MDKKIKALFFDIDGTLVSFKSHRIPQSTVDALEQAKKNGVEVYISTGRPKQIINNLGQIEHLIDGYITANGARCKHSAMLMPRATPISCPSARRPGRPCRWMWAWDW